MNQKQKALFSGLTVEERDEIAETLLTPGWKPLLKVFDALVREQEESVLRLNADDGVEKLLHAKLKAEGARKLRIEIESLKASLKENR